MINFLKGNNNKIGIETFQAINIIKTWHVFQ